MTRNFHLLINLIHWLRIFWGWQTCLVRLHFASGLSRRDLVMIYRMDISKISSVSGTKAKPLSGQFFLLFLLFVFLVHY